MFFSSSFALDRLISAPRVGIPAAFISRVCPCERYLSHPPPPAPVKKAHLFSPLVAGSLCYTECPDFSLLVSPPARHFLTEHLLG